MTNIVEELREFATDRNGDYDKWHRPKFEDPDIAEDHLLRFFGSTMDEVRLWRASQYGYEVLALTDVNDYDHFRRGVLRREVSGEIAYTKQRDHSAHTLYNYLLGWYFYSKADAAKEELHTAFKRRQFKEKFDDVFADVWAFASLLHDIGYLFEGALAPLSSEVQDDQVRIGGEVAQEYFSHRFWTDLDLSAVHDRKAALELSHVKKIPQLERQSMTGLAYSLRSLGNLEPLRKEICRSGTFDVKTPVDQEGGLAEDAFALWKENYIYFDTSSTMAPRIDYLEEVFLALMQEGFAGSGMRILDHGVCSGLLLLLAATFYFRVGFGMDTASRPLDSRKQRVWTNITEHSQAHGYTPSWWWQATVWASAATAIHNVLQMKPMEGLSTVHPGPLSIDDDPLAYLGILVDILQEWDRHTVARLTPVIGGGPLQGIDVAVRDKGGVLGLSYDSSDRAGEVKKSLDRALKDWKALVEIE